MRRVAVLAHVRQQLGRVDLVRARPQLRLDDGIGDLLRPFRTRVDVALGQEGDAACMVLPHVAREAQDLADAGVFRRRIERLCHDVAGDRLAGQGRDHFSRCQYDQVDFIRLDGGVARARDRRQAIRGQDLLQQDVVDRVPERDRDRASTQVGDLVDLVGHRQRGPVDVVPGDDFRGELGAIAHPQGGRRQKVNHVDLAGDEGFDDLRPAAEQPRRFRLQAFRFKQLARVRDQQRGGVGDRQVADFHRLVVAFRALLGHGVAGEQQGRGDAGRGQGRHAQEVAPCQAAVAIGRGADVQGFVVVFECHGNVPVN
ncbi:hypothetical protein D3C85_626660 [compost metagenome]